MRRCSRVSRGSASKSKIKKRGAALLVASQHARNRAHKRSKSSAIKNWAGSDYGLTRFTPRSHLCRMHARVRGTDRETETETDGDRRRQRPPVRSALRVFCRSHSASRVQRVVLLSGGTHRAEVPRTPVDSRVDGRVLLRAGPAANAMRPRCTGARQATQFAIIAGDHSGLHRRARPARHCNTGSRHVLETFALLRAVARQISGFDSS